MRIFFSKTLILAFEYIYLLHYFSIFISLKGMRYANVEHIVCSVFNKDSLFKNMYYLLATSHNVFGPTVYLSRRDGEPGHFQPFRGILEQKLFNKMCSEFNFI